MLTATPASNGAPADSAAKADRGAAERCACRARAAWYAVGRAARGEGDADRGPLQHSTRQAGDICAVRRCCQIRVSQFACLFVSFRCFWSKRSSFPPDRVLRADERESSPTPEVRTGRVFWLETWIFRTFDGCAVVHRLRLVERKLATVLFVDLVDSTALVAGADPEVARRRVTQFFERVSHSVITHGGIVEKFAGEAVLAAFGIPQAHEDDAERAVRAALAMLDSVAELGLEARVGVESGEVVVDESDSTFATGEA